MKGDNLIQCFDYVTGEKNSKPKPVWCHKTVLTVKYIAIQDYFKKWGKKISKQKQKTAQHYTKTIRKKDHKKKKKKNLEEINTT